MLPRLPNSAVGRINEEEISTPMVTLKTPVAAEAPQTPGAPVKSGRGQTTPTNEHEPMTPVRRLLYNQEETPTGAEASPGMLSDDTPGMKISPEAIMSHDDMDSSPASREFPLLPHLRPSGMSHSNLSQGGTPNFAPCGPA